MKNPQSYATKESEVKRRVESIGCKLLSCYLQPYGNEGRTRTRVKFICKCGKESDTMLCNLMKTKNCKECGKAKKSGPKCYMYDPDREAVALRKKFRKVCGQHIHRFMKATGQKKTKHTHELLGYTPQQLQDHILNHPDYAKVKDGMWHIDHIFPLKAFLDHGIFDLRIINALNNLRPLVGLENLSKADKYDSAKFQAWLNDVRQLRN
jgi:hypothetical protein